MTKMDQLKWFNLTCRDGHEKKNRDSFGSHRSANNPYDNPVVRVFGHKQKVFPSYSVFHDRLRLVIFKNIQWRL